MTQKSSLNAPLSLMEVVLELVTIGGCIFRVFILIYMEQMLPDLIPSSKLDPFSGQPIYWQSKTFFIATVGWSTIIHVVLLFLIRNSSTYAFLLRSFHNRFNLGHQITEHHIQKHYRIVRSLIHWINMELTYVSLLIDWKTIQFALGNPQKMSPLFPLVISIAIVSVVTYHLYLIYKTLNVRAR